MEATPFSETGLLWKGADELRCLFKSFRIGTRYRILSWSQCPALANSLRSPHVAEAAEVRFLRHVGARSHLLGNGVVRHGRRTP